jgi:tetratricopeptide (TPR) repeat protein
MSHGQLLLRAAEALLPSLSPRVLVLAKAALDAFDADAEPEDRAAVIGRIARMNWVHHRGPAAAAAYEQAVALLAGRPPSAGKARSLAELGESLLLRSQHRRAATVLRDALSAASAVRSPSVEAHALCMLGTAMVELGQAGEGLSMLRRALQLCHEAGEAEDAISAYANYSTMLEFAGCYEEADRVAEEGAAFSDRRATGGAGPGSWAPASACSPGAEAGPRPSAPAWSWTSTAGVSILPSPSGASVFFWGKAVMSLPRSSWISCLKPPPVPMMCSSAAWP